MASFLPAKFNFNRHLLPHLLVLLFFLLLTVAYFSPIFFDGKSLMQHDVVQFQGGAKEIADYRQATGEEALWTNSMFSGMPAYLISVQFSGDLFQYVHHIFTAGLPLVASNVFITLLCAYILFAVLGLRPMLSAVGAIAYTFVSYNFAILEAGHNTKSLAIAYLPLVLAGLIHAYRKNLWVGAALFAFGLTMHIRVNHLQITYYLLLIVLIFGIVELVHWYKEGRTADFFKRTAILAIGALLAAGVSFGRIYTTAEYGQYSIRGASELKQNPDEASTGLDREYAFQWSYGIGESMTLLIPNFYGGASQGPLEKNSETYAALSQAGMPAAQLSEASMPFYWGDQSFVGGPVYMGAIICFLFVLGLMVTPRRLWVWLLSATILSLFLAWGKNFAGFNYFIFDALPGYNKFRAVSMALVIAQVTMVLLAILALCRVIQNEALDQKELQKKILIALGIVGGICAFFFVFSGIFDYVAPVDQQLLQYQYPVQAIRADRQAMLRGDALRSLVFILLAGGALYMFTKRKLSSLVTTLIVGFLILVDLWGVDKRYLNDKDFQKDYSKSYFTPTTADEIILRDKSLSYRVYNVSNPFNDARTSYFHKSIGGYHGAKLRRYQDVIENHIAQGNMNVLNMLNTRYAITGKEEQPVQQIPGSLGNAWFVQTVRAVNSPDEELETLKTFDPGNEAIVDVTKFPNVKPHVYGASASRMTLTEYKPNYLKYDAEATQDGVAVFSEIYYKDGWQAYLDGKPVDHFRVNYILRAMPIPNGKHTVEFKFEPVEYTLGNTVSLISSLLLLAGLFGAVYVTFKRRKPETV